MRLRDTPRDWRRGFALYRRTTGTDSLGNETAVYSRQGPDLVVEAQDGLAFQSPRSWNSGGKVGTAVTVEDNGEVPNGILECCLRSDLEISPFDRLEIDGELWEVRSIQHWPSHRKLILQRVR